MPPQPQTSHPPIPSAYFLALASPSKHNCLGMVSPAQPSIMPNCIYYMLAIHCYRSSALVTLFLNHM